MNDSNAGIKTWIDNRKAEPTRKPASHAGIMAQALANSTLRHGTATRLDGTATRHCGRITMVLVCPYEWKEWRSLVTKLVTGAVCTSS
jgi:hypothetical protein